MRQYIKLFTKMIEKHGISFLPLHSIRDGRCTCGNEKCISPGKHPRIRKSWKKIASNDEGKLKEWQEKYQETLNLGVCTGELPSGKHLVVLDFDVSDHALISKLPQTFNYITGSGGHHFWFFSDKTVNNSISSLAEKVDVRGAGGYVVVPPSRHLSGLCYHFHEDSHHEIAELPEWFFQQREAKRGSIVRQGTGKQNKELAHHWSALSVPEIRERLDSGTLIPNGARNTTIHRLLSSDRAKGTLYKQDMWQKALTYRARSEEPTTITDNELSHIVSSAMKYEPYNNYDPSKVLDSYVKFMNKSEDKVNEEWVRKLDEHFFSCLSPADDEGFPLAFFMKQYERFFKSYGVPHPPHYKSQLFARKLREMGFERKRSSTSNTWRVSLEIRSPMRYTEEKLTHTEVLHMSDDTSTPETEQEEVPTSGFPEELRKQLSEQLAAAAPQPPAPPAKGDPEEVVMIRDKIEIKHKQHPNLGKYARCITNIEYHERYLKKLDELTDEQSAAFSRSALVQNEEKTREFLTEVEPADIIGLGYELFTVIEKNEDDPDFPELVVRQRVTGEDRALSFAEVDFEVSLEAAEILYRGEENGKPKIHGEQFRTRDVIFHVKRKDLKPGQEEKIWYPEPEEAGEEASAEE